MMPEVRGNQKLRSMLVATRRFVLGSLALDLFYLYPLQAVSDRLFVCLVNPAAGDNWE